MPALNGYETCQKIRQLSNVPILFLSARTSDSDKLMGFSSGGDDYLAKPFSYTELLGHAKSKHSAFIRLNSASHRKEAHLFYERIGYEGNKTQKRFLKIMN